MNVKGKNALGTVDVPFDTLVKYRTMLVETANNIEVFVKKQLNPLLGTEKLMNEISTDEKEQPEEFDAIYNKKEHGFVCNYEDCSEGLFFETVEIVEHLKSKHRVNPDDQLIDGWTDKHEKTWQKAEKKKSKTSGKSLPVRWNYSEDGLKDMNMGELWNIARKMGLSRKGKKDVLIQRILKEQKFVHVECNSFPQPKHSLFTELFLRRE